MKHRETPESLLYLASQDVENICKEIDSLSVIRDVFQLHGSSEIVLPDEAYLSWKNPRNESVRSLNMPGFLGGSFRIAGTKIINSNPENRKRGQARASGLTLLFDRETVRVICVMDASYISALRTAAVSLLCVNLLAEQSVCSLAVIGAGVIGRSHIQLAAKSLPSLQTLTLFDEDAEAVDGLMRDLEPGMIRKLTITVSASAKEAVRSADIVIPATTATSGYLHYEWLKPGSVVINVSLDDLLPDVFLKSDLLFVDDWNLVRNDSRRTLGKMHRQGLVAGPKETAVNGGVRRIDGEISDLVLGRHPGRTKSQEIVIVNPFGLAIEDIALATRIYEIASLRGVGIRLRA